MHVGAADHLDVLRSAVDAGERVELEYYSFARDEMTTRTVDPARVFNAFGAWYLAGYCYRAEGARVFRIDRVRSVRPTGEPVQAAPRRGRGGRATSSIGPVPTTCGCGCGWSRRRRGSPTASRRSPGPSRAKGRVDVVLAVSGDAFLERLLLGLGPSAKLLGPPEAAEIVAGAARRVLERYGAS